MIKSARMECVDWLSRKKTVELTPEQINEINKQFTVKEFLKRFIAGCRSYSKSYWITGYVNGHKVCWFQWAEI